MLLIFLHLAKDVAVNSYATLEAGASSNIDALIDLILVMKLVMTARVGTLLLCD